MHDLLRQLLSPSEFMPHGHCYLWRPGLVWLHVVSDLLIWMAYMTIPFTLIYFIRRRKDVPFNWIFLCFGVFIIACGFTHLMEVWTLWHASYWLSGAIKALTAVASVGTAILLLRLIPLALAIPSPAAMRQALLEQAALARAKEAAEAASRTKSLFLANMSHELRTPLNAVIGYSEMLQEEAAEQGLTRFVPDLQKIQGAGRHLLALISDILDLSKIEAGKMDLFLEVFSIEDLVREVAATIQPLLKTNHNTIEVQIEGPLGTMRGDATKLRQSLFNLLSNACKFTERGRIVLRAARQAGSGGDTILLSVADTGIGMSAEELGRLFQSFSQADPSTTRRYGGSGLGLAITRHFCRMMGGDVSATSEPGSGSTFLIRLPAEAPSAEAAASADAAQVPSGAGPLVLVIDDDPMARDLMRRLLEREGFRAHLAGGGEEGLRQARALLPSLITLDVLMPGLDGWAVLSALKADPELAQIPVVIASILDQRDLAHALGAADYLTKPIERERLAAVLRRHAGPSPKARAD